MVMIRTNSNLFVTYEIVVTAILLSTSKVYHVIDVQWSLTPIIRYRKTYAFLDFLCNEAWWAYGTVVYVYDSLESFHINYSVGWCYLVCVRACHILVWANVVDMHTVPSMFVVSHIMLFEMYIFNTYCICFREIYIRSLTLWNV